MLTWIEEPAALGVVGGAPQIVLIHGGQSTKAKLEAAMLGANVAIVYRQGLSGAYDEKTGIAKDYPMLVALLKEYAPSWSPGAPLFVLAFSAGGWALRHYLRDPATRNLVNTAIFLDSLYGTTGDQCNLAPYDGVVAYGKEANASPSTKKLIMTYSQAHPGPGTCSRAIEQVVGKGPGVVVRGYANADHGAQQSVAGPEAIKKDVAPWWGERSAPSSGVSRGGGLLAGVLVVAAALGLLWATMRVRPR